jgi:hypothetical protein
LGEVTGRVPDANNPDGNHFVPRGDAAIYKSATVTNIVSPTERLQSWSLGGAINDFGEVVGLLTSAAPGPVGGLLYIYKRGQQYLTVTNIAIPFGAALNNLGDIVGLMNLPQILPDGDGASTGFFTTTALSPTSHLPMGGQPTQAPLMTGDRS